MALPALQGTEKQVVYAETIRVGLLTRERNGATALGYLAQHVTSAAKWLDTKNGDADTAAYSLIVFGGVQDPAVRSEAMGRLAMHRALLTPGDRAKALDTCLAMVAKDARLSKLTVDQAAFARGVDAGWAARFDWSRPLPSQDLIARLRASAERLIAERRADNAAAVSFTVIVAAFVTGNRCNAVVTAHAGREGLATLEMCRSFESTWRSWSPERQQEMNCLAREITGVRSVERLLEHTLTPEFGDWVDTVQRKFDAR